MLLYIRLRISSKKTFIYWISVLGVPKFSFRSELINCFKSSIRRTERSNSSFWTNWTNRTDFFSFFLKELNWWNSSFERTELFKQFAQNELNCSKSSARSKTTCRSVLSLIWTEFWTWAGAPLISTKFNRAKYFALSCPVPCDGRSVGRTGQGKNRNFALPGRTGRQGNPIALPWWRSLYPIQCSSFNLKLFNNSKRKALGNPNSVW
jgi:hypothetical protein